MFGLSWWTILLLITWGLIALAISRCSCAWARGMQYRIFPLLGVFVVTSAYLFQPWIKFQFIEYLVNMPYLLKELLPLDIINYLVKWFGVEWLTKTVEIFGVITGFSINGLLVQFVPSFGFWTHVWAILPLLLVIPVVLGIIVGPFARGKPPVRFLGGALFCISLVALIGLITSLPDLDALGIHGDFAWLLLSALLGVRLGNGPWITILGLILFAIGGVVEFSDTASPKEDSKDKSWEEWA
jgi:hypothetical protein